MNLHEYQSKELLRKYGVPVSKGITLDSTSIAKVRGVAITFLEQKDRCVVKAQVHAGGRGKAGGVKLVKSPEEAEAFAKKWLGKNLVTFQTDKRGQPYLHIL